MCAGPDHWARAWPSFAWVGPTRGSLSTLSPHLSPLKPPCNHGCCQRRSPRSPGHCRRHLQVLKPQSAQQVGMTCQSTHGPHRIKAIYTRHNPMVTSLPFLQWPLPAAPAAAIVDRFQLQGVFLLATCSPMQNQSPTHSYLRKGSDRHSAATPPAHVAGARGEGRGDGGATMARGVK